MSDRPSLMPADTPEYMAPAWIDCWQCAGNGKVADCFEDCCSCLGDPDDPDDCCNPRRCDVCKGKGGWLKEGPMDAKDEAL